VGPGVSTPEEAQRRDHGLTEGDEEGAVTARATLQRHSRASSLCPWHAECVLRPVSAGADIPGRR
jgi:hypothetical protein